MKTINSITQAVILAGGKGERLRPLTDDRPKPMVLVNGRPFLECLINLVKKNGIEEVVLLLGYLPEKVMEYFGDGSKFGLRIKYSVDPVDLSNGARIKNAEHLLDDTFLLMHCDHYWPLDLVQLFDFYKNKKKLVAMLVYDNKDGKGEYGAKNNLKINNDGLVLHYGELSESSEFRGNDLGFAIVQKKAIEMLPQGSFSWQKDLLPILIKKQEVVAYITGLPSHTITDMRLLRETEAFLKSLEK